MPSEPFSHLRLAGVIRLALGGRGPRDAFVFDPHRLALPCWALGLEKQRQPALLVTLDRHLDLVPPAEPSRVPRASAGVRALDEHARYALDLRNVDHICAAMEAGLISDALVIARSSPVGALKQGPYVDARGQEHELLVVPTVDRVAEGFGSEGASSDARRAETLLARAETVVLDIDLDCFTSPCDADPTTVLPWPEPLIRDFLLPRDSEAFWEAVLKKTVVMTLAREPVHAGGLLPSNLLLASACQVLFAELLGTDLP